MKTQLTSPDGTPASRFSFGTMQFGGGADPAQSQALYEAVRAQGITFFDTAFAYTKGQSETLLGQFAAAERDSLVIATKCGYAQPPTAANIRASLDQSRQRLGMDFIDVYYLHRWSDEVTLGESFDTLAALQAEGIIGHIGVSNYAAWQVMKAEAVARSLGTRIAILQPMYNLVKRQVEVEIMPMAVSEDFLLATYSPLGGGLLTGKYVAGAGGRLRDDASYAARYGPVWMHEAAAGLAAIAREYATSPATLAVAWVAHHAQVSHPILSARTPEQLAPSVAGMDFVMDDALFARISALVPTPAPATDRLEEA